MERIPFKKVNLGNSYEQVKPLFETGFIGLGKEVEVFERELADYVGAPRVIATDSCTSALFLSLKYDHLCGVREVTIPSMTVPLVANACLEAGMEIKFNGETEWVGSAYPIEGSRVIDSAHQLQRGQYQGFKGTRLCFSFYPTKTIGSADGGAIATDDKTFYDWAKSAATYGRDMNQKGNSWDYDTIGLGYKRHYTNLQAVICLEQLRRLDTTNARRQEIAARYNEAFGLNNVSDYLYRMRVENRDEFIRFANGRGVECGVHFKPLHLMTPFKNIPMTNEDRMKAEEAYAHTVSLPFFDLMTDEEVARVIEVVKLYENTHSQGR